MDRWHKFTRLFGWSVVTDISCILFAVVGSNIDEEAQAVCAICFLVSAIGSFAFNIMLFAHVARLVFDAVDYLDHIRRTLIEIKNKDIKQI